MALLAIGLVALGGLSGCVERRYTLRTNPPGAQVIVNGEEIGPTPVSRSFTYYGDREITLMLDGYQTQTIIQPINARSRRPINVKRIARRDISITHF